MRCCSLFSVGIFFFPPFLTKLKLMKVVVVSMIDIMLQMLAAGKITIHFVLNVGKVQKEKRKKKHKRKIVTD